MQNQQLFEAPFISGVHVNYCSQCNNSEAFGKCTCKQCQRVISPSYSSTSGLNTGNKFKWMFESPVSVRSTHAPTQADYIDAMSAPSLRSIPGGRGGRIRTHTSQWPKYLSWSIRQIQHAIVLWTKKGRTEKDKEDFYKALKLAENGINGIINELPLVMSGQRQHEVLKALRYSLSGIQDSRRAAQDKELPKAFPGMVKVLLERKTLAPLSVIQRKVGLRIV